MCKCRSEVLKKQLAFCLSDPTAGRQRVCLYMLKQNDSDKPALATAEIDTTLTTLTPQTHSVETHLPGLLDFPMSCDFLLKWGNCPICWCDICVRNN